MGAAMEKKVSRLKRARRSRAKILELRATRLSVHRTAQHIQRDSQRIFLADIADDGDGAARWQSPRLRCAGAAGFTAAAVPFSQGGGNIEAAKAVGKAIAERAKAKGVTQVAFDRSGFKYHGRIKALAEAAREAGLEF